MDRLLLYSILKGKSGAEVFASGNPVTLPNTVDGGRMKDMKVYGWSKQESTSGKNLFDFSRLESDGVNVIDYEKQTITVPAKTNNTGYNQTLRDLCPDITPGTYVFSMNRSNPESGAGSYFLEATLDFPINTPIELTDELLDNHIAWYNNPNSDVENVISEIQIEAGDAATAYEPYTGGQPSPSPDYPQQIVSAGSDGKIGIEVRGKNLVDIYGYSAKDIPGPEAKRVLSNEYGTTLSTTDKTDKLIVHQEIIDGTNPNSYTSGYFCIGINERLEEGKNYKVSFDVEVLSNPFGAPGVGVMFNGNNHALAKITKKRVATTALYKAYNKRQYVEIRNAGMSLEISNFMITEVGETDDYEPYHEQTVQLPYTINAIPVASGGNVTIDGQQYIADYVDVERGKYVQTIQTDKVQSNITWIIQKQKKGYSLGYSSLYKNGIPTQEPGMEKTWKSNIGDSSSLWSNGFSFGRSSVFWIVPYENDGNITSDDINAWLVEHPMDIMYPLASPIERDLTPEEIEAYKNLVTYAGTTIVENDAECYMEVSAGGGDSLRAKKLALILGE